MKTLLLGAVGAFALMGAAHAADLKFALIPKGMDNPILTSRATVAWPRPRSSAA